MNEAVVARARRDTIGDAVRRSARVFRERPALHFDGRDWSFADIDAAAGRIGAALLAKGLRRGDRVVAYGRNSDAYFLTFLACAKAGLIHVPANYALTHGELAYVIRQSGAVILLHDPALAAVADAAATETPVAHRGTIVGGDGFDMLQAALAAGGADLPDQGTDDEIVQIIYTSGTTGQPKGVALSHRALTSQYMSCIIGNEYSRTDRCLAALPLYHVAQMHAFCIPMLLVGSEQWLIEAPAPATWLELIERHRLNSFFAPPTVWITLLRHADFAARDLSGLRTSTTVRRSCRCRC